MDSARTALVTGGNRGIGLAIVAGLAREGFTVLMGARDATEGLVAAEPLHASELNVYPVEMDISSPEEIARSIAELQGEGRQIDVLVNNAGVLPPGELMSMPEEDVLDSFAVNVIGPILLARALAPGMVERGYGRIVNVSSGWGSFAEGLGPGAYGITKAALNAATIRLAAELPETVKVNALCPGWVRTRMGGADADRSPEEGADTAIWLATLPDDGPTGGFFRDHKPIAW